VNRKSQNGDERVFPVYGSRLTVHGSPTWRVFCAITLPAFLREQIEAHIARSREAVPGARASWNRDEKLHLTIKFLGDIPTDKVGALAPAAARAVDGIHAFSLAAAGCGAFPSRGQPRVLWIGVLDETGELARLHRRLDEECAALGFPREQRAFRPHLTIARVRHSEAAGKLAEVHKQLGFPRVEFPVSELTVIRSELRREGSLYTDISRHPLAK